MNTIDRQTDICMDRQMDTRMDTQMERQMDRQLDGQTDRQISNETLTRLENIYNFPVASSAEKSEKLFELFTILLNLRAAYSSGLSCHLSNS